MILSELHYNFF